MNIYVLLPLMALIANVALGTYILSANRKEKFSRLYALFSFSIASWSLICALFFISNTYSVTIFLDKLMAVNSLFTAAFLLHFFIIFTRQRIAPAKTCIILYTPVIIFAAISLFTNTVVSSVEPARWGNAVVPGGLYDLLIAVVAGYTLLGLFMSLRFYLRATKNKEKQQALLLIIAVGFLTAMGLCTEMAPILFGKQAIPLTSTFSTVTTVIVAYAIAKYNLMNVTSAMAVDNIVKTMADYLIVVDIDKTVVLVDNSLQEALGMDKSELLNKNLNKLPLASADLFEKLKDAEFVNNFEAEMRNKDGSTILVSINASTMKDKNGDSVGYVLVMRDVGDARKLIKSLEEDKKKIESANEELEQMNKLMVGRELKMIELKNEIKELEKAN